MTAESLLWSDPFLRTLPASQAFQITSKIRQWGLQEERFLKTLDCWFSNFERADKECALRLFLSIDFYDEERFKSRLETLGNMVIRRALSLGFDSSKLLLVAPGPMSDSGHRHTYDVRQVWKLPMSRVCSQAELADRDLGEDFLVIFNDTHGTGNQFLRDVWPFVEPHATRARAVFLVATAIAEEAFEHFGQMLPSVHIIPDSPTPSCRKLLSSDDFERLATLGKHVYPRHSVGFGGTALAVAYYFQCPNSSLPLIWADGKNNEIDGQVFPWSPLFRYIPKRIELGRPGHPEPVPSATKSRASDETSIPPEQHSWFSHGARLIGAEKHLVSLRRALADGTTPGIVSIEGLGGIGKTTLASIVATEYAIHNVTRKIAWYSFRQEAAPEATRSRAMIDDVISSIAWQLRLEAILTSTAACRLEELMPLLATHPFLIVLDNMETEAEISSVLPLLRAASQARPTRILVTSRASVQHLVSNAFVEPLTELQEFESLELLRHEARLLNLTHVVDATDEALQQVYNVVGGNPLALKLAVGLLRHFDLAQAVDTLSHARGWRADELYKFVYRTSWQILSHQAKTLLVAMRHISLSGANFARVSAVSHLEGGSLLDAIQELADLSLLIISGPITARVYSVHRLTVNFVQDVLGNWGDIGELKMLRDVDSRAAVANVRHSLEFLDRNEPEH